MIGHQQDDWSGDQNNKCEKVIQLFPPDEIPKCALKEYYTAIISQT